LRQGNLGTHGEEVSEEEESKDAKESEKKKIIDYIKEKKGIK